MADKEYPVDEFDRLASERKVRGAHRRQESNRKWWIALVAVLVIAPLIGWGLVHWAGQRSDSPLAEGPEPTTVATDQATAGPADPEATPTADPTEAPEETPEPTEEPVADPDLDTPVQVRNASLVAGHAAQMQQALLDAGYTNVAADNFPTTSPTVSQVFYPDESFEPTALAVAEALGIPADADHVVEGEGTEGTGVIIVVLAGDLG
ncbi:MAG: LytR C-terminal domain-containing protein [Ancrocorticia sp.]|uniref:LytR C-terminal domain-containing protein n=1 Tax=Ancrocorticia sp. TaxID=2593684 RepID=UPI003F91F9BB